MRAKLYTVPRDGAAALLLLTDHKDKLKRLVLADAYRRTIVNSSRPAFVFISHNDLTFWRDARQPNTLADFLAWLETMVPHGGDKAIHELSAQYPDSPVLLFAHAPNGCVGISVDAEGSVLRAAQRRQGFERIAQTHASRIEVQRYSGKRIDLAHIFERNMNTCAPLTGRRIALIGCGTIGSHLAKFLVQNGAGYKDGKLHLLDDQTHEPGNVGRHYLGTTSVGEWKARALRQSLLTHFPEANIQPVTADAIGSLANLTGYDLVVDTTGEEALSMSINHYFVDHRRDHERTPDVVHVRLFGNGAAAQGLLVDGTEFACFKCLKPDHNGGWRFNPLRSNVGVTQTAAACGEAQYIAYGVAAPAVAAALGLQLVLDWNNGMPAPRMRTIRIEKKDSREVKDQSPNRSDRCPACGGSSE